jgi:hypothetical protein
MIIQENDFLRTYNEIDQLWEDANVTTTVAVDMNTLDVDNLTDETWDKIKQASMALCGRFRTDVVKWPKQFQLQYNAYKSELKALEFLKDSTKVDEINKMLKAYGESCRIQGSYKFNDNPCKHNILGVNSQIVNNNISTDDDTVVDIILAENVDTEIPPITKIEVKCVYNKAQPKSFHGCQVLFVFDLADDSCTVYYVKNNKRPKQKTPAQAPVKFSSVGLKQDCIFVSPKEDYTVADATGITCKRWGRK